MAIIDDQRLEQLLPLNVKDMTVYIIIGDLFEDYGCKFTARAIRKLATSRRDLMTGVMIAISQSQEAIDHLNKDGGPNGSRITWARLHKLVNNWIADRWNTIPTPLRAAVREGMGIGILRMNNLIRAWAKNAEEVEVTMSNKMGSGK